jgi:hypothetical protein
MMSRSYSVPGVYRQPGVRAAGVPRVRTDVVGFAGVAGAARLYQATPLDDWRSFVETFLRNERGALQDPPPGSQLAAAAQSFFANGGSRCWVVNVAEALPAREDDQGRRDLLCDMLGQPREGSPTVDASGKEVRFTGLELLLAQEEVAVVALPELDAAATTSSSRTTVDQPVFEQGRFSRCTGTLGGSHGDEPDRLAAEQQLFTDEEIRQGQRALLDRCERDAWRVFAIVATPRGTTAQGAAAWRTRLGESGAGALYWPWLRVQPRPGQPLELRSPVGAVAGVFAWRDLSEGPQAAPANASLTGVVALESTVDDLVQGTLYDAGVNVLRAFPGRGIALWGARTLQWSDPDSLDDPDKDFVFVNVRRCLSAIERTVERLGQTVVFEPNLPLLRVSLIQRIVSYLLQVFQSGALAGDRQETAFFVRCDGSNNPPESIEQGRLICDVGVALAAPAEFIVFRLGRNEGLVEIEETA